MQCEPKVLTFDVVGTLIDFETGILDFLHRAWAGAGVRIEDEAILAAYRQSRASPNAGLFADDLARVYQEIASALGHPADARIADAFRESSRDWPAFPDSVAALHRLKARYGLVAMTNAQRWAFEPMAHALGDPFHDTVTVDEARCEKPGPAYFAFVRGRLSRDGYGMQDILHVAQSQYHDIGVARRLGYTVAWVERRNGKGFGGTIAAATITRPHYHFATLAELADAAEAGRLRTVPEAGAPLQAHECAT
jgi:putative hydrolase of the HAD superfamily